MKMDLFRGTLAILILRTLQSGPQHGWLISERIQELSQDFVGENQGSLYPAPRLAAAIGRVLEMA